MLGADYFCEFDRLVSSLFSGIGDASSGSVFKFIGELLEESPKSPLLGLISIFPNLLKVLLPLAEP